MDLGIPGLRRWKPSQEFQGPFTFVPVLYVQQLYPTFMGWVVGYNKKLRKMSTQQGVTAFATIIPRRRLFRPASSLPLPLKTLLWLTIFLTEPV